MVTKRKVVSGKWLVISLLASVCLALITNHSPLLFSQQPQAQQGQPLYSVNAKYVNGVAPGYWPTTGAGLVLNLSAGTTLCGNPPVVTNYAGGTLTLTASQTNYVYLDPTASCAPAFNITGFQTNQISIATVTTGASAITAITDVRSWFIDSTPKGFAATSNTQITITAATDTKLAEIPLPRGYLNLLNRAINVYAAGSYTNPAAQTPTLTFKVKLCTVSLCGSGTVLTLLTFGPSGATTASVTNNWQIESNVGIAAAGASGTLESHGLSWIMLGATGGVLSPENRTDANTAVSAAIDLTQPLFLDVMINESTSASNTAVARLTTVTPAN